MFSSPLVILVVEDDDTIRELAAMVLESAGYHVLEASSADQALVLLAVPNQIALVFSDIQMPGTMNGIGLACQLRERGEEAGIVLTSGVRYRQQSNYPLDVLFLEKPYTSRALLAAVSTCLSDSAS